MTLLPRIVRWLERGSSSLHFHYQSSANMCTNNRRLRVLVDMDGVIADFEGGFLKKFKARYPNEPFISLEDRRGFWVSTQYGDMRSDLCVSVSNKILNNIIVSLLKWNSLLNLKTIYIYISYLYIRIHIQYIWLLWLI